MDDLDKFKKFRIDLIECERVSSNDVIKSLEEQKAGTVWAQKTNEWAITKVKEVTERHGDFWQKGFLEKSFLYNIVLPNHSHDGKKSEELFSNGSTLKDAVEAYKNRSPKYSKACVNLIEYLKGEIKKNGFTQEIVLYLEDGLLKHVDGLHRMIALALLIEEGYDIEKISIFLLNPNN